MLLPADAVPRETQRRRTRRRDRKREDRAVSGDGRGWPRTARGTREAPVRKVRRKWNGEKARHEARYFPHGERSLFTSPLSESAPTGASEKEISFFLRVEELHPHTYILVHAVLFVWHFRSHPGETYRQSVTLQVTRQGSKNLRRLFLRLFNFEISLIQIRLG